MAIQFTETEIDRILDSVDAALSKSAALAKSVVPAENEKANGGQISSGLKKDDMAPAPDKKDADAAPAEPAPESAPAEAAPEAPAAEAAAPEAAPEAPESAPEEAAEHPEGQPAEGEQALEGESDAPLSDEELSEIYGSMEPQELERHFMLIRGLLQQAYAQEGGEQPAAPAPEAAPAPAEAPAPEAEPAVAKSEGAGKLQAEHEELKKQYAELQKSLENTVKVLEVAFKPERKAVTSIEYIKKGEEQGSTDAKSLVKSEIVPVLNELTRSGKLSKSERDAVNDYVLNNGSMDKIAEIIKRK